MAIIQFDDGTKVEFNGTPTQKDVEEVHQQILSSKSTSVAPQKSLIDKVLDNPITRGIQSFFPGQKVGQSIGTLAGAAYTGAKDLITGRQSQIENYDLSAPTPLQTVGDIALGTAQVAGLKMPLPVSSTVLGTAAKTALQTGVMSAVSGAGQKATENGSLKEIAKGAFTSGLTGAVTGGVIGAVSKGVSNLAEKAPDAIYNNTLKVSQKLKDANKSPAEFLNNEKLWGGLGTFKKASEDGIQKESSAIAQKVSSVPGGATYGELKNKALVSLKSQLGDLYSDKQLKKLIDEVPVNRLKEGKILNWKDINEVRSTLGDYIGDSKWLITSPSEKVKAAKAMYGAMASTLQDVTGTQAEFSRLSKWITTKKLVDRVIDKADAKFGLGLFDKIAGSAGLVVGGSQGDTAGERIKNAATYGAGAVGLERLISSPSFQTFIAQKLQSLPVDTAGKISREAVVQIAPEIADFINNLNK